MTATAERIQKEFATLSRDEREELVVNLFQVLQAEQAADWPMSAEEEAELRASLKEVELDFKAGKGIPHEEIVRRFASWGKRDSLQNAELPLTPAQSAKLDRRLNDMEENPSDETPWEEARKRIAESGHTLITGDSMADAAQKVVKTVGK